MGEDTHPPAFSPKETVWPCLQVLFLFLLYDYESPNREMQSWNTNTAIYAFVTIISYLKCQVK